MKHIHCVPGCILAGYITNPNINNGQPLPLFTPNPPADKPSINTLEGWNAAVDKANRKAFSSFWGRNPQNNSELLQWLNEINNKDYSARTTC